jgi:hypothetical protein
MWIGFYIRVGHLGHKVRIIRELDIRGGYELDLEARFVPSLVNR